MKGAPGVGYLVGLAKLWWLWDGWMITTYWSLECNYSSLPWLQLTFKLRKMSNHPTEHSQCNYLSVSWFPINYGCKSGGHWLNHNQYRMIMLYFVFRNCQRFVAWHYCLWGTRRDLYLTHLLLFKMAAILADDIFKCIFLNENDNVPIEISLKLIPRSPIDNKSALV